MTIIITGDYPEFFGAPNFSILVAQLNDALTTIATNSINSVLAQPNHEFSADINSLTKISAPSDVFPPSDLVIRITPIVIP